LALRIFQLKPELWRLSAIGLRALGSMQHADENLAVFDRRAQLDLDSLAGKTDEIRNTPERPVGAGRADLQALVINVFDLEHPRQLPRNLFAVFDPDPGGTIKRDTQQPERRALDVDQLDVRAGQRLLCQRKDIRHKIQKKWAVRPSPLLSPLAWQASRTPAHTAARAASTLPILQDAFENEPLDRKSVV